MTKFKMTCAEKRTLRPLCQHLKFDKVVSCKKGIKLQQQGLELGPEHHAICEHFKTVEVILEKEETLEESNSDSRKKNKKTKEVETSSEVEK